MLALGALTGALIASACLLPFWRVLDQRAFDVLSTIRAPDPKSAKTVIVAIDEPSMAELGRQWPWPRSIHARLVRDLRAAGAKVVALDIVFSEPSTPDADEELAKALGPNVVLAADFTRIPLSHGVQDLRINPQDLFLRNGAQPGLTALALDRDGVLRRLPPYADSFAAKIAALEGRSAVTRGTLLQFFGPPRHYPTISYYQALDPAAYLPRGFLRDRTVLVGLSLQNTPVLNGSAGDAFATPYTFRTGLLTAGVEAQATILDNLRDGLLIWPAPTWVGFGIILLLAIGAAGVLGPRLRWRSAVLVVLLAAITLVASWVLLRFGRVWLSPLGPVGASFAVLGVRGAEELVRERRQRRAITRAFAHYLAPELVDRLARDPTALRLGGVRRELTVLFCDIRGFTALAERMKQDPERLTSLLNRLMDPLSETILRHGGTVDKFIGDCVMAFWNAPLEDPGHASHAVRCGLEMLSEVERVNGGLAMEFSDPPEFLIGIGINTGECVVGNMGSQRRFDYSAIGDAVNLAARLEALSKVYRVPLLIGPGTRAALGDTDVLTVELDRIALRGRTEPTPVYAAMPLDDIGEPDRAPFLAHHAAFLAAWRVGDRVGAIMHLDQCMAQAPSLRAYYRAARSWIDSGIGPEGRNQLSGDQARERSPFA